MSIAGIRSNRGDIYQTLIAFDWALTVLSDPEFQWLEIDSTTYMVDDVVIGKSDDSLICCQCKKNQVDFRAWSIADLAGELDKASLALATNKQAQVRFYSRSEFGALAKLREYRILYGNEAEYQANLTKEHIQTNQDLAARIAGQVPDLSTYEFLYRTSFEISPDFDRMETLLRERLRQMASNSNAAYDALYARLDKLGGRMEGGGNLSALTQHRLTKDDLEEILHHAGAMLAPVMSIAKVRTSFASTSAIGRSWHRDIAGQRISSPVVDELLAAIDDRKHSVLLTGLPGSGKTCVLLSLQEILEQHTQTQRDIVPLFIQSREFTDMATAQERQAQGLPEQWVEQVARLSEDVHVVVIIDSLDVLSIAREQSVLTYFLAQIDQLLLIPNVTVITACRDFDRRYDRRIAARQWECELQCLPLDWETQIAPLLEEFGIDSTTIDAVTRELIRNPRELALFVELAQLEGSFSVVNSQTLAQRYLYTIVQADPALGDPAMQAIEDIANAMLRSRSLSIPYQRFSASQDILRRLHSLNVLQDTHDGKLTFGHQTILDVLVISGAMRQGISLNEFIQGLPPVPFVRPSIRSFVAQLATGERREFRKQLRAVLTGNAAFHIRRLIAEAFAQQMPQDDDWPMIQDLRDNHREVYQVIYTQASKIEWHHFWLEHLVPILKDERDANGLATHAYRVSQWKNESADTVLAFWTEILQLDWIDKNQIVMQLPHYFLEIDTKFMELVAPLLEQLLIMHIQEHSLLGHAVARCVSAGPMEDMWLWHYIAGDISDDDVSKFKFNNKLYCQPSEFGKPNNEFLLERMEQSTNLLDLALESIEKWSRIKSSRFGNTESGFCNNFLSATSYEYTHSQEDIRHKDSENFLFDAIEAAILNHSKSQSNWWKTNRERLCLNYESALRYFAILAFTRNPELNVDLIGRILNEKDMLESELSFELGKLLRASFIYLDTSTQDDVMACILTLREGEIKDEQSLNRILKKRAEFIICIPPYLRSTEGQSVLENYEKINGVLIFQPDIKSHGGFVRAPFSFEVFNRISDNGVLSLLAHYTGYRRTYDDFLVGGEHEVGRQLGEASSRHPTRFLSFLSTYYADIADGFRNEIMSAVAIYLEHRYGHLKADANWEPLEEPDAAILASHILDELERHPKHWYHNRSASNALEACANVITDAQDAARLVFLAIGFASLQEEITISGDNIDLITIGINMMCGNVVEALMILANRFQENRAPFPELLAPTLRRFAGNEQSAIRSLILRRLPYLQSQNPELGWNLFHRAMLDVTGLWQIAEPCLYHAYHDHFDKIAPLLGRIHDEGTGKELETWGRISALAAMSEKISIVVLLDDLKVMENTEAWKGAASVWAHPENIKLHLDKCMTGLKAGLTSNKSHAKAVAQQMKKLFRNNGPIISIPIELAGMFFSALESDNENKYTRFFEIDDWLNIISYRDPLEALAVAEIYLPFVKRTKSYLYDYKNNFTQLLTRLFAEAEEREEADCGAMLRRVVFLQDMLLSLGVGGIENWLKAAERP